MRRTSNRERGASLVLFAMAIVFLVGLAAIVVDMAMLRADIRSDQLASDAAATAGVAQVNPFAGTGIPEACQTAWEYVLLNLEDEGPSVTAPNCGAVFGGSCDPLTARAATATAGPYGVTITHPVPDGHPLMGSQAIDSEIDGVACQRLAVTISRNRSFLFGRVLGFTDDTTTVKTVARVSTAPGEGEIVPLLLLEPIACEALYTSGQGKVTVSYNQATQTPGIIVVDSNASDCGPSTPYSIDSKGTQKGWIRAIPVPGTNIPSAILSYALSGIGAADPSASYDPSDVTDPVNPADLSDPTEPPESRFRLYPVPIPSYERITRAPIDWRYNCKSSYPDYPLDLGNPGLGGIEVAGCPFPTATYIDTLVATYTGPGVVPGFNSWAMAGYPCDVGSAVISVSGNWHVECPDGFIVNGGTVSFNGSVVFDGGVDLRSDSVMNVNVGTSSDVFVYVRDGDGTSPATILKRAQASLQLDRTFVYLENGAVDLRAGDGGLVWTSPDAGSFEDLALWSEAPLPHEIGGQAGNVLTGTFFTPMAEPFSLTGQAGQFQFEAQFITRRLEVKGQGEVKMTPDPEKTTPIPARAVKLIR